MLNPNPRSAMPMRAVLTGLLVGTFLSMPNYSQAFQVRVVHGISRSVASPVNHAFPHTSSSLTALGATALSPSKSKSSKQPPQIVEFIEPKTNVRVVLIGTMHYNPTSIKMVEETVEEYAKENKLGSVIVESCDLRWNKTMEILETPRGALFEPVLTSEMKAASDMAMNYQRPVVLGDQRIDITGDSLKQTLKQTFTDLTSPIEGWKRYYVELKKSAELALPSGGEGYLDARSIFDPRLLIAAPISFAKYPLSFLARNPISTSIVFAFIGALNFLGSNGDVALIDATLQEQISSILASLLFAGLETAFFARLMISVLLEERNEVIAKNILDQCKIYSTPLENEKTGIFGFNLSSFFNESKEEVVDETMYVPGSIIRGQNNGGEDKVVLCVLGMAHCNGIVNVLKNELVE